MFIDSLLKIYHVLTKKTRIMERMDLSREPWNTGACALCRRGYAAKVPLQIHHGQSLKTRTMQRIGPCRSEGRVWAEPTNTGPGTEFLAGSQGSALSPRRDRTLLFYLRCGFNSRRKSIARFRADSRHKIK
jgi:hypothetical protein